MNKTDNIIDTYIQDMAAMAQIIEEEAPAPAQAENSSYIFHQYLHIQNEYLSNFSQSTKYIKQAPDNQYLLVNGLNTLTHIFKVTLEQTAKPILALDNMQKAIYYYRPFIEQMEENILHDLNVSSNSASIFVYKKTIGAMELSQIHAADTSQRDLLNNIEQLTLIHRLLFNFLFTIKDITVNEVIEKLIEALKELGTSEAGTSIKGTSEAGTSIKGTSICEKVFQNHLANIILFIRHITSDKELDINAKYDMIHLYIKNYKKEPEHTFTVASLCKKKGVCSPRPPLLRKSVFLLCKK